MVIFHEHCVSLIALAPNQAAPVRVPLTHARLASLQSATVREWIERRHEEGLKVFAVPGRLESSGHRPVLVVGVEPDDYERLTALVPPCGQ